MSSLPVNDAVPGAVTRLRESLRVGGMAGAVAAYFRPEEDFAGLSFTCLGTNPPDVVTASDLLAVSLLDITWRPEAVRQLLDAQATTVSELLSAICIDLDLWQASDDDLATVDPLWDLLLRMPGVGHRDSVEVAGSQTAKTVPGQRQGSHRGRPEYPAGHGRRYAPCSQTLRPGPRSRPCGRHPRLR